MQTTEKNASETREAEFYDLLWDEMDRHYAKVPPTKMVLTVEEAEVLVRDEHNNPERD